MVGRDQNTLTLIGNEGIQEVEKASEDAAEAEFYKLRTYGGVEDYFEN